MKTSITPTPTDLDKLKDDIAVEVSIVFKHAKLGTDYTINCTNTIASMAENYARALIQAEIVKALETLEYLKSKHTDRDVLDYYEFGLAVANWLELAKLPIEYIKEEQDEN